MHDFFERDYAINARDPLFAALFAKANHEHISVAIANTTNGVMVNETGTTPCSVALLQVSECSLATLVNAELNCSGAFEGCDRVRGCRNGRNAEAPFRSISMW